MAFEPMKGKYLAVITDYGEIEIFEGVPDSDSPTYKRANIESKWKPSCIANYTYSARGTMIKSKIKYCENNDLIGKPE